MKILIITGEISGDQYGSELALKLKDLQKDLEIVAIGGDKLFKIANIYLANIASQHAIGITELFFTPACISQAYHNLELYLQNNLAPNKAIIIDFGHYNFKFAHLLQKYHIPIITFITPNFWIWQNQSKAKKIINYSQKIITIFKPEYEFYQKLTKKPVYYFGHPLSEKYPKLISAKKDITIGILPGSRWQEIHYVFEVILKTIQKLQAQDIAQNFMINLASNEFKNHLEVGLNKFNLQNIVKITTLAPDDFYAQVDLVLTSTGTASLEALLYQKPVIVLGALSKLSYLLCKYVLRLKLKYIALPNILADTELVPEIIQNQIQPDIIIAKIQACLNQDQNQAKYNLVRQLITKEQNPLDCVAKTILLK